MAYGTVKVDNITFDKGGVDQNVTVSGIHRSITSGITVTGTISGAVVIGSTSVSGAIVQGGTGTFTSLTGTTTSGTTANFVTFVGALTGNASTVTTNANLTGDITSVGNATSIAAGAVVDADINASAAIVDTKLATISTAGKVSNSATTATNANTASAIVARDASGNFTAGTITAVLTGAASSNVLKAGDTMTGDLVVPSINGGPLAGMRNAIINGNFDNWQRGTSFTLAEYGADRWIHGRTGTTHTATRQAFTIGQTAVPGEPTYFCRTVVSSVAGAGNFSVLAQRIEDVRSFAGQQITVSFWAKVDATKNIAVELEQFFGTGGTPSASVTVGQATKVSIGTTFQKVTVTTTVPSISGKTLGTDSNHFLTINIFFDAGSSLNARTDTLGQQSGTFEIAQVQIEAGPVATPFERRSIGTELALCQRYFNKSYAVETNPGTVTTAGQLSGSFAAAGVGSMHSIVRYPVVMRSTATVTVFNPVTGASNSARRAFSNVTPTQGSEANSGVIVIIAGGTSADNYAHHYTADAEL